MLAKEIEILINHTKVIDKSCHIILDMKFTYDHWSLYGDFYLCCNDRYFNNCFQTYSNLEALASILDLELVNSGSNIVILAFTKIVPENDGFLFVVFGNENIDEGVYFTSLDNPDWFFKVSDSLSELFYLDDLQLNNDGNFRIKRIPYDLSIEMTYKDVLKENKFYQFSSDTGFLVDKNFFNLQICKEINAISENELNVKCTNQKILQNDSILFTESIELTFTNNNFEIKVIHPYPSSILNEIEIFNAFNYLINKDEREKRLVIIHDINLDTDYVFAYVDQREYLELCNLFYTKILNSIVNF